MKWTYDKQERALISEHPEIYITTHKHRREESLCWLHWQGTKILFAAKNTRPYKDHRVIWVIYELPSLDVGLPPHKFSNPKERCEAADLIMDALSHYDGALNIGHVSGTKLEVIGVKLVNFLDNQIFRGA